MKKKTRPPAGSPGPDSRSSREGSRSANCSPSRPTARTSPRLSSTPADRITRNKLQVDHLNHTRSPREARVTASMSPTSRNRNGGLPSVNEDKNFIRSPKMEESNDIRQSRRQRKVIYDTFNPDYMITDDAIRSRCQAELNNSKEKSPDQDQPSEENSEESTRVILTERDPSRLRDILRENSNSAKPGSPRNLRSSNRYDRHKLRKTRLQNLTSDDEQSEFNRRYSRDLRSRRKRQKIKDQRHPDGEEEGDEAGTNGYEENGYESDDHDERSKDAKPQEIVGNGRPVRKSARMASVAMSMSAHFSEKSFSDFEVETKSHGGRRKQRRQRAQVEPATRLEPEESGHVGLRRSSRKLRSVDSRKKTSTDEDTEVEEEEEEEEVEEEEEEEEENEDDDNSVENSRRLRPRRSRMPDRWTYEAPSRSSRGTRELRNLDQYSTEEEFDGGSRNRIRRKKYNMRENRQTITRFEAHYPEKRSLGRGFNRREVAVQDKHRKRIRKKVQSYKDSSSSSSSSSSSEADEVRFQKRKIKRMNIERAKLMPMNMNKEDVSKAIFRERKKIGSSLADVLPMEMDMKTTFDSIGGCDSHVEALKEMVVFPLIYPEIFTKYSINPPRGVLFYGPPGTGKTLMARALASECSRDGKKVAFFMRKGADCLSKWIGESERQLRLLFDQAYLMRPSIIFFDEIDGLAPVRSSRQDQIHSSIVSTLLALMDGLDNRGEIIVIGATNRIENIDPALRRPGRFDRELRFGLPTRQARKDILQLHTKSWVPPLPEDLIDILADKSIGYCGADLKGLCAESALNALRRKYPQVYQTNKKLAIDVNHIDIKDVDFFKAMKSLIPSTHRIQEQTLSPLPRIIRPLLQAQVESICRRIDKILPLKKALISADDVLSYRPRLLIHGESGQGLTTYLGPAVLHHLENIPCHKLDIPALYSNSVRTPEEALCHIFHEAKRTIPSCIYMPHVQRLWRIMNESVRETFQSLLLDIMPNSPLLILAVLENSNLRIETDLDDVPAGMFSKSHQEMLEVELPNARERNDFFSPLFQGAMAPVPLEEVPVPLEDLPVVPIKESRELTEKEEKRLRKKEEKLQRELRIFLRDVWAKLNKEQKFFMFRVPVDTEEVYDYLDIVKEPMDFDKMLTKLDDGHYKCAQDFLNDIDLIAENAIAYNSDLNYETNKVICHRAKALQDFSYALIKAEMDTDFEDECKEIIERRKKTQEKLENMAQENEKPPDSKEIEGINSNNFKKRKAKRKASSWSKGEIKSSKRRSLRKNEEEIDDEEEEEVIEEDEDHKLEENEQVEVEDEMVPTGIRLDQSRLNSLLELLVANTSGFKVEKLERIYTQLSDIISSFRTKSDRTDLPKELEPAIDALKTSSSTSRYNRSRN